MSVKSWEAVLVKVEPSVTDDLQFDTEERRNSHDTQLELKEEPDWNIQDYLATSRCKGHVVQNHLVCSRSKDMTHMEHDRTNKTDIQVGFHIESIVKIEGDIDLPDVNKANWQVNEYTHKSHNTQLMQSKTQSIYTNNNKETASANSVASPTSLYIEHVVKIEREIDEDLEVTVPCRQAQVDKAAETKADNTRHPEVANDSETVDTILKAECASPVAGLYVDHVVEKDLVVGPETLQRPNLLHCQAMNGAGSNTAFDGCFVRLETMHVDVERGVCRIGLNTYKLAPCLHQDYYTQQEIKGPNVQKDQNKQMITNAKLLRYQVSNIQEKPFKCDICHFATAQKHRLTVHKRSHSDDKPFRCQLCSYASAFKAHLVIHEKTHAIHKPFKCDKCNYACVQKSDLLVHERVHTGVKPFKCDYCVYACRRKRDLLKHIRTHTGEKPFKCELCDYGCIRKRDLIVHANAHRMPDGEEIKVIQKLFECGKCSYASLRKRDLLQHERVHTGEKPFKCDYCVYASSRKRDLLTHIKAHISEKRYKCKQCIYDCSCKQDFPTHTNTRHIIDGRDEKRHKCSYCDYKTNHKSHMLVHQRKHTGEKPFKCKHCKYATPYRRDLLVHETLHKGEKPHKCNSCSYACGSLSNLRTHEKIHAG